MDKIEPGPYRRFERLVQIKVLGQTVEVPENNVLLRCFQFISPETISYGRFCWNEECQYCRVIVKGLDGRDHKVLSCKLLIRDGMEVVWMDEELVKLLKKRLALPEPERSDSAIQVDD